MSQTTESSALHTISLLLARAALGGYLVTVGYGKLFGKGISLSQSYEAWMGMYQKSTPAFLPSFIATPYGYAFPWLEMSIGLLLIFGAFYRVTTIAAMVLLLSIYTAMLSGGGSFAHQSAVFAMFALMMSFTGPGRLSLDAIMPQRKRSK